MPAQVTVFGGTGFLGRRIVERLVYGGTTVRVAVRHPERVHVGAPHDGFPRMQPLAADVRNEGSVVAAISGVEAVVNAVSAYVETRDVTYSAVHVRGAAIVASASARENVRRLVHLSGIGADPRSRSAYIRARGKGELAVKQAFPGATIIRPSVMFANDDAFLNSLARIVRLSPMVPLIGGGCTKLQPVHADDVAEAVCRSLSDPLAPTRTYELGGQAIYTLREIIDLILTATGRRRRLFVPVPYVVAYSLARLPEILPQAPLTVAQVDLLRSNNVVAPRATGIGDLDLAPRLLTDTIAEIVG